LSGRILEVNRRKVWLLEKGSGFPLVYLHGFADVHAVKENLLPFHETLAQKSRVMAPAHPGCAHSEEYQDAESIDDIVFHYLEALDALKLREFDLVGACVGGWIAAEIAVRHPEMIRKLVLIGATGLFVPGAPIGDVFMMAQPERGTSYAGLRSLLFASADHPQGREFFPDGRGELDDELRRYQMLRFGSRVGFRPPYFYNRTLTNRLHRIAAPTLVLWGREDRMVPLAHGETYARSIANAERINVVEQAGHSVHVEMPGVTAQIVSAFLAGSR
jgi:pimeloyl-ACP methyl ester carboxylesterase